MFDEHIKAHDDAIRADERAKFVQLINSADKAVHDLKMAVGAPEYMDSPSTPAAKAPKPRTASKRKVPSAAEVRAAAPTVLAALAKHDMVKQPVLAHETGLDSELVSFALRHLIHTGAVGRSGKHKETAYCLIAQSPQPASEQQENGALVSEESESPQQEG
jgi:hypothetical protein